MCTSLPLISVITVCYNSEATISEAIDSVNRQCYDNIEHIFIDGGSTDRTCELISKKSRKLTYFRSEKDNGIYDAMNKGVSHASGDYICFLNADDFYSRNDVISNVASVLRVKFPDLLYTDIKYVDCRNPNKTVRTWFTGKFKSASLRNGWMPPHPGSFVRKDRFVDLRGFDERYSISADYDFLVRLCSTYGAKIEYLPIMSVIMKTGGVSNRDVKSILAKMSEDYLIIARNNIGGIMTLILKNIRKIGQFF